ncbi:MAG TPA: DUF3187 family protein [bacterium]|nr:DUF3187 family protein [bacterium]
MAPGPLARRGPARRNHRLGRLLRWPAALCLAALLLPDPVARAQAERAVTGWGPFAYTSQSLLHVVMFDFEHEPPVFDAPGLWRIQASADWTNVWDYNPERGLIDGESWYFKPKLRYTVADGLEFSLSWPLQHLGGGMLDGLIENFHSALGLDNAGRDRFPHDQLRIERFNPDGSVTVIMDDSAAGWYGRAPVLSGRLRLTSPGASWPVALKASVNFPHAETTNRFIASHGHDWALGLSTAGRLSTRWHATLAIAGEQPRSAVLRLGLNLTRVRTSALASFDYGLSDTTAMVFELLSESGVARDTGTGLDKPTTDFVFGWKWQVGGSVLELGIIEDLFVHDNNIDFGLHFGYRTAAF